MSREGDVEKDPWHHQSAGPSRPDELLRNHRDRRLDSLLLDDLDARYTSTLELNGVHQRVWTEVTTIIDDHQPVGVFGVDTSLDDANLLRQ